jgi:hypothetical protein
VVYGCISFFITMFVVPNLNFHFALLVFATKFQVFAFPSAFDLLHHIVKLLFLFWIVI